MALANGPRLGPPSATSFKVWARFSGAATITLEVRETGASTWTLADTQAVVTTKLNTVVLTASSLTSSTKYDWRVLEDAVEVATNTTWTMPVSGRFVVYYLSDQHSSDASGYDAIVDTYAAALSDFETNYEPSSIPAFIIQGGDFVAYDNHPTNPISYTDMAERVCIGVTNMGNARLRLPIAYMFDDWDWAGNNSGINKGVFPNGFNNVFDPSLAQDIQDWCWRDRPQDAPPSYGYTVEVCNVPFIMIDNRSQKYYRYGDGRNNGDLGLVAVPYWNGDEPPDSTHTCYGDVQREWLKDEFRAYADRAMVVIQHGCTLARPRYSPASAAIGGPSRDGPSIYYPRELEEIMQVARDYGYGTNRRLVALTGDDHACQVWDTDFAETFRWAEIGGSVDGPYTPPATIGMPYREFKVGDESGDLGIIFVDPNLYDQVNSLSGILRIDITSTSSGRNVTARYTILDVDTGIVMADDDSGNTPDWYFHNGVWTDWADADATTLAGAAEQAYPPDNGAASGVRFQRSYLDDISGALFYERDVMRDHERRIRELDDIGDTDRDELLDGFPTPPERELEPLE